MKLDSMSYLAARYQQAEHPAFAPVGFVYYDSRVSERAEQEAEEEANRQDRMGRRRRKEK